VLDESDETVDARRRESSPVDFSAEMALDGGADALWAVLRNRLEAWSGLQHAGVAIVAQAHGKGSAIGKTLAAGQDKAARARALAGRLFGTDGLTFTRTPYPEQAQAMASILRLIEKDGLANEIDELTGPEILVGLRACQAQYEGMVAARLSRDGRKSGDLGILRGKLLRAIARYTNAVLGVLDEDDPDSLQLVTTALLPLELLRTSTASSGSAAAPVEPEDTAGDDLEPKATDS
jgi:hypothetical protein